MAFPQAVSPAEHDDLQAPASQRLLEPTHPELQPPQWPGLVLVLVQPASPQLMSPTAQASVWQALPWHLPPAPQLLPHWLQCWGSTPVLTHAVPLGVPHEVGVEATQLMSQPPATQATLPVPGPDTGGAQTFPHVPQLLVSVDVFTH